MNTSSVVLISNDSVASPTPPRRHGLVRNVLWSWAGQVVMIASGFLLPRFIDHDAGRAVLGVWDFSWSLVGYFSLIQLGIGASVNVYVAKHLAENDTRQLNRAVSSVFCIQLVTGFVIFLLTLLVVSILPMIWRDSLGGLSTDAQWLVFFLGAGMALGLGFGCFDGVLTGCHRWDLHNVIDAGYRAAMVLAMIGTLRLGHGLCAMGFVYFAICVLQVLTLAMSAHIVCPSLRIRGRDFRWAIASEMLGFGGKAFLRHISNTLLFQTNSVLIASSLGPGVLALYSRPVSLVQNVRAFSVKFAHTLTPIVSEMGVSGDREAVARMAVEMVKYSTVLALVPIVFLSIMGGPVLLLWMGGDYRHDVLIAIIALGQLASIAHQPLQTILVGLNSHGRPAIASLIGAAVTLPVGFFLLPSMGVNGPALAVSLALFWTDAAYLVPYSCRKLNLPVATFLREAWGIPVLCILPFTAWLIIVRFAFAPLPAVLWAASGGGLIVLFAYWTWIVPQAVRTKLLLRMRIAWTRVDLRAIR
jgi:O-antigen/teichoic acid export membrane protein